MKFLNRLIYYPFCFAALPILALLGHNIKEVALSVVIRPLVISWIVTILLSLLFYVFIHDWHKSALSTSLTLILFYSYGHVYHTLRDVSELGFELVRHRYFIFVYLIIFLVTLWLIVKRTRGSVDQQEYLNVIGICLLIYPMYQIVHYYWIEGHSALAEDSLHHTESNLYPPDSHDLPDVYYIILDSYTRADSLMEDYLFDNSDFLDSLRELGFYIGECSRCNHCSTITSLVSSLNMDYIPQLQQELKDSWVENEMWLLIKNSRVRTELEALGYKTIAFDTGTEWTRLRDADMYLGPNEENLFVQVINPFEALLIKNSAGLLLHDFYELSVLAEKKELYQSINFAIYGYELFAKTELNILDTLPQLPAIPGPKWAFAHILIPHVPRIFTPSGDIVDDPGFYSGVGDGPINEEYEIEGYVNEVQFVNHQMLDIVNKIITSSSRPVIIVLQGDHGGKGGSIYNILNAYYFPKRKDKYLYPEISPVNTFRLIFDSYLGGEYGLLSDVTFTSDDPVQIVEERFPHCVE